MRRGVLRAGALAVGLLVAACGANQASQSAPAAGSASTPPSIAASSASPGPTLPMPSGADVQLDPTLMALLPGSVAGVAVTQEPESFAEAAKDPAFVASVDRAVFVIAVSGSDLASGVVAHLRPGVYSDKMFEDWRATYDEGACGQAGGVVAHAQKDAGGRTTYVTTCGGGLRVFHAYLPGKGVLVSLFSTGSADLGGQLIAAAQG